MQRIIIVLVGLAFLIIASRVTAQTPKQIYLPLIHSGPTKVETRPTATRVAIRTATPTKTSSPTRTPTSTNTSTPTSTRASIPAETATKTSSPTTQSPIYDVSLVFDGDSLTKGNGTPGFSYPLQAVGLLGAARIKVDRFFNFGVPGQSLVMMEGDAASEVDTTISPRYREQVLVAWGGTNEVTLGPATVLQRLKTYAQHRRDAGFTVIVLTMLPRDNNEWEADRLAYNDLIRAEWRTFADGIADVGADARIGDAGDQFDLTYYLSDKIHMNEAGYGVVASIVQSEIRNLIQKSP